MFKKRNKKVLKRSFLIAGETSAQDSHTPPWTKKPRIPFGRTIKETR
jgi:hypothetical protein